MSIRIGSSDASIEKTPSYVASGDSMRKRSPSIRIRDCADSLRHANEFDAQPPGLTLDASSRESRHVGAGDLVAGYAHALYMSEADVRQMAEAFPKVVLNGGVVRVQRKGAGFT
jgi:hypothetical protein